MTVVNPYLTFNGNCEEAFEFYKSVFGGEFTGIMRFDSMDCGDQPMSESEKNKVMHVALPIGGGSILMGSDTPEAMGKVTDGSNFAIAIAPDSKEEADRLFDGLSAGGQATMPMDNAPWGGYFGMFTDKFGFAWMINYSSPQPK
jgi:PhnB protein